MTVSPDLKEARAHRARVMSALKRAWAAEERAAFAHARATQWVREKQIDLGRAEEALYTLEHPEEKS